MKNKNNNKQKKLLFLLLLAMGVGFAYLSTQLVITGRAHVNGYSWDVHFANINVNEESIEAEEPTISSDGTVVDYYVEFDMPGDMYEFTVDVVNGGLKDAIITSVELSGIPEEISDYVTSEVTYVDGSRVYEHDILKGQSSNTYKIRLQYDTFYDEETGEQAALISTDTVLHISLTVDYELSDVEDNEETTAFTRLVRGNAKNDRSLDFSKSSSSSNGNGLYVLAGTEEDVHPIYYYRGAVTNNNIYFAGLCWKAVRTTDTGGTKLIYNGTPTFVYDEVTKIEESSYLNVNNDATYPFTYDSTTNEWTSTNHDHSTTSTITFTIAEAGTYYIKFKASTESVNYDYARFYTDDTLLGTYGGEDDNIIPITVTSSTVIKVTYSKDDIVSGGTDDVVFSIVSDLGDYTEGCRNTSESVTQIGTSAFNSSRNSLAYNGYMYGTVYPSQSTTVNNTYLYGTSFSYNAGTYTLTNPTNTLDENHHYTCFNDTGTCTEIAYVYYLSGTTAYSITLANNKDINTAISEMNTNTNDSAVKATIDTWFSNNISNYFTNLGKNYNDYLEDTVFCNDRSMITEGDDSFVKNGWKTDGNLNTNLYYSSYDRLRSGKPSLSCNNKNDSFTVTESAIGNGALTYPVGLLTADEVNLAGGQSNYYSNYYLNTNQYWWTMSPSYYTNNYSYNYTGSYGNINNYTITNSAGVRPVISLASTVLIENGGDGTADNPYRVVIE